MAMNKGMRLGPWEERESADELRMAVKEVICDNKKERSLYEEALVAITVEESLKRYCQRIGRPDFWGGEPELLVLSRLCCQPIVYTSPNTSMVEEVLVLSQFKNMVPSFMKVRKKGSRRRRCCDCSTQEETIMIC